MLNVDLVLEPQARRAGCTPLAALEGKYHLFVVVDEAIRWQHHRARGAISKNSPSTILAIRSKNKLGDGGVEPGHAFAATNMTGKRWFIKII